MTSEAEMVAKLERQPLHDGGIIVSVGTRDELIGLLGRTNRWEAIARRLAHDLVMYTYDPNWPERYPESLAAFRELADPT